MGEMLWRNPYPCITNGEKGLVPLLLDAKYHLSTCIGIQNSVIKQIHDRLDEACFVSQDSNSLIWLYLYRDAMFGGKHFGVCSNRSGEEVQAHRFLYTKFGMASRKHWGPTIVILVGPHRCCNTGNLVVAFKVAILLGVRTTRTIGIWTFFLDAFAFETDCFCHDAVLLSFGICAVVSFAHCEHKPSL